MSQEEFGQLYWNGVRDALRMVETFVFWKEKNSREKRTIKDFVSEALEAVRQKCAPCLKEILGINFGQVEEEEEEEAAPRPASKFAPDLTPEEAEPIEEEREAEPLEEPTPEPAEEPMPEALEAPEPVEERVASSRPDVFLAPEEEEAEPEPRTPAPEETREPESKPFAVPDLSRPSPTPTAPAKPAEPEEKEKPKRRTFFF